MTLPAVVVMSIRYEQLRDQALAGAPGGSRLGLAAVAGPRRHRMDARVAHRSAHADRLLTASRHGGRPGDRSCPGDDGAGLRDRELTRTDRLEERRTDDHPGFERWVEGHRPASRADRVSLCSPMDREGFQRLVADVGLGKAGIVLGLEVSRLARNNADWHRQCRPAVASSGTLHPTARDPTPEVAPSFTGAAAISPGPAFQPARMRC